MGNYALCWDCKNATGGCSWSSEFKPVKGWVAKKIGKTTARPYSTYKVEQCPEFVRDSCDGGLKKLDQKKESIYDLYSRGSI